MDNKELTEYDASATPDELMDEVPKEFKHII